MRHLGTGLALSLAAAVMAGCGADDGADAGGPVVSGDDLPFAVEEVADFEEPWAMAFLPDDGGLLVTERTGELHLRDVDTGESTEVSGVPEVEVAGQGGLGDIAVGPTFSEDQAVYLSWVESGDSGTGAVVGRAQLDSDGDAASLEGLEVVWRQSPKVDGDGHFAHRIAFDPEGEHLFITSGDRQQLTPAQDTSNTVGTIVRLTLDGDPAPGNPLADEDGVSREIWSWGHRNPLGLEFAPDGTLWSSEMGPQGGDELNIVEPGENYGWPEASEGVHYNGDDIPDHTEGDGFAAPEVSWVPAISPGSLMIYSGDLFEEWAGDAFLGGLSAEALVRVDLDGTTAGDVETFDMGERIREVVEGPDGAIYVLEDAGSGRLLRLTPSGASPSA